MAWAEIVAYRRSQRLVFPPKGSECPETMERYT